MRHSAFWNKKGIAVAVALVLLVAAGVSWMERGRLLSWYYLRGLSRASTGDRDGWIEPVIQMDTAAVPALLKYLEEDDEQACSNAGAALDRLTQQWGLVDPRSLDLTAQLTDVFPQFSLSGKISALQLVQTWLNQPQAVPIPEAIMNGVVRLLDAAREPNHSELHDHALDVLESLARRGKIDPLSAECKEMVRACLGDDAAHVRIRAIQLAAQVGQPLVNGIVPLLRDPDATVRQAALRAVGPHEDVVGTDELLRMLHDPDKEVRQSCEAALRRRNLSEQHIKLGRLITDKRPAVRLQVLDHLNESPDLEPGVWLYRLSEDVNPAVRAAAVRAAVEQSDLDLGFLLQELAFKDQSPTVSQLARYYLSRQKGRKVP